MAVPTIDAFSFFFAAYNELELLLRLQPASSVVPSLRITDLCLVNSKLNRPLAQLLSARYRCGRFGVRFPGRSNRHSVANDSPPLRRFFGAVLPRRQAAEMGPATRYTLRQWRGNVFWTGGAQNSKIVSTSGGRSPPDPPFFRTHVFESRTLSRPILIDINCMPA